MRLARPSESLFVERSAPLGTNMTFPARRRCPFSLPHEEHVYVFVDMLTATPSH
ncbi:MAG: hypothetical protein JOZ19_00120 [Rubrobacter sp.]|nr:hypothetical protein [Rubrobacter sp.]